MDMMTSRKFVRRMLCVALSILLLLQVPGLFSANKALSLAYSMPREAFTSARRTNVWKGIESQRLGPSSVSLQRALQLRGGGKQAASPLSTNNIANMLQTISPMQQDVVLSSLIVYETLFWLKSWSLIAKKGLLSPLVTRKLIHSFSAPLFLFHWPFFRADNPRAALIASIIPLLQIVKLYLAGVSDNRANASESSTEHSPNELVAAVSRTGASKEALGGPLIYSVVLFLTTLLTFTKSPIGLIAVCQMAAGDGLADIFGRRFGTTKWWFSSQKSVVGTLAFVGGGFLCSISLVAWFMRFGLFPSLRVSFTTGQLIARIFAISLFSAFVELLGTEYIDDNISVPIAAALASYFLFYR